MPAQAQAQLLMFSIEMERVFNTLCRKLTLNMQHCAMLAQLQQIGKGGFEGTAKGWSRMGRKGKERKETKEKNREEEEKREEEKKGGKERKEGRGGGRTNREEERERWAEAAGERKERTKRGKKAKFNFASFANIIRSSIHYLVLWNNKSDVRNEAANANHLYPFTPLKTTLCYHCLVLLLMAAL